MVFPMPVQETLNLVRVDQFTGLYYDSYNIPFNY